ncbi:unnamed protein product [Xylocopa violacea]|uniref:Cardioactive peptide n=1 Tax=Xylocopa violacea TaxID=135666 RepID=A0ABP1NDJ3_XYLVO
MKVTNCVCCIFILICLMYVAHSEKSPSKVEQQFLDAFTADESLKTKRPFCNAFTGCGRKRNLSENPSFPPDSQEVTGSIRIPLSLYKALLRAATQYIRNTIDHDTNEFQLFQAKPVPQVYLSDRMPHHKRFDIPSTSLN